MKKQKNEKLRNLIKNKKLVSAHLGVWENNILLQLICWASKGPCKW